MELRENAGRLVSENGQRTLAESESTTLGETDLPPEYCQYRDEGCELADSCLNCSLPRCVYDQPGGRQKLKKSLRNREIVRQFARGLEVNGLAVRFGVSQRTIYRALRRARNE